MKLKQAVWIVTCPEEARPSVRAAVQPMTQRPGRVGFYGEPPHEAYTIAPKETDG